MDYAFTHEGKNYTPNGTQGITDAAAHNAALEAAELAFWESKPERMLGYYKIPGANPHPFVPTPGFPYRCNTCGAERGLAPELCSMPGRYREDFRPMLNKATVTTWPGKMLGNIIEARVYRHNFGGRFISLTMRGTNGATYTGRASYDNGECVNLRKCKA